MLGSFLNNSFKESNVHYHDGVDNALVSEQIFNEL